MKNISPELKAHLAGQVLTVATLWLIARQDGQVFAFTDLDSPIEYQGQLYESAVGYTPSSVVTGSDLSVDNMEMSGVISSETITEEDLAAGVWDYAEIDVREVNYKDLSMGHRSVRHGRLGNVKTGRNLFTAELRGLTQNLQQSIAEVYAVTCSASLFDSRCKVDRAANTHAGEILTALSQRAFITNLDLPPGLCNNGLITFTSGANAGKKAEVKFFGGAGAVGAQTTSHTINNHFATIAIPANATLTRTYRVIDSTGLEYEPATSSPSAGQYFQVGNQYQFHADDEGKQVSINVAYSLFVGGASGQVELQEAMFGVISSGDTFEITAGCDKRVETCRDKFNNVVNIRAVPYVRSSDAWLRSPR